MYAHPAIGFRKYGNTNPFGAAHMAGLRGLGGDDSTLVALGFSSSQIQTILSAHNSGALSDTGYSFLLQGGVPVQQLNDFLAQDPGAPESSPAGSSPASSAGVPTGSTITYQGQWASTYSTSPADIVNQVARAFPQLGLTLVGSQIQASLGSTAMATISGSGAPFGVTLNLRVSGPGFAYVNDAQANIDHALYQVTGKMPTASSAVVSGVPGAGGSSALPTANLAQWFEQNATMIFVGLAVLFIGPQLVKRL
jgi:hypothetical protein